MNFVCNLIVPSTTANATVTKVGSCGSQNFSSITTGPYTKVNGTIAPNNSTCNTNSILN